MIRWKRQRGASRWLALASTGTMYEAMVTAADANDPASFNRQGSDVCSQYWSNEVPWSNTGFKHFLANRHEGTNSECASRNPLSEAMKVGVLYHEVKHTKHGPRLQDRRRCLGRICMVRNFISRSGTRK